jgi:hypothetical protein
MTESDMENAPRPVTPQTPVVSELWTGPNRLHSVSGWVSHGDNGPCGCGNRLSSARQHGSSFPIALSISDNNVLDRASIFFRGAFHNPFWNRRGYPALVASLDSY